MSYTEQTLVKDEQLLLMAKKHWFIWVAPVFYLLLAIVYTCVMRFDGLVVAFLVLILINFLIRVIMVKSEEQAVTTKRVVLKTGIIRRETFELNLAKVESVQVSQGIFGRIFNYGNIVVYGTGRSSQKVKYIADPLAFRAKVLAGLDEK